MSFEGCKLFVEKKKGNELCFVPKKGLKEVKIGSSILGDIRITSDLVRDYHCKLISELPGKILVINLCKENPILVNDVIVEDSKHLKDGDIIQVVDRKIRFELNGGNLSNVTMSAMKEQKSKSYVTTKSRITIHEIGLNSNKAKSAIETTPAKKSEETPFSTPTYEISSTVKLINKENTPKKLEILNKSETVITSYTPTKVTVKSQTRLSRSLVTPRVAKHDCSVKRDLSTPKSVYGTPKSVLSEVTDNLISFTPAPVSTQKKSMHLIDLTTPHPTRNNISATSTPNTSRALVDFSTPKSNKASIARKNTLLKSALKNSTIKNTPGKSLLGTPARNVREKIKFSPISSQDSSKSVISITDSNDVSECSQILIDDTVIETDVGSGSSKQEGSGDIQTKESCTTPNLSGVKRLMRTPGKGPKNDLSNFSGVKRLMKTPARGPVNDLSNVSGVKKLMKTPARQPVNDLSNVSGVKQLMKTPAREPTNDLSNVSGIKRLMKTPARGPVNDLSNVSGVEQLMKTPAAGSVIESEVKDLMKTPNPSANDLSDVRVLVKTPARPDNDTSLDLECAKNLTTTPNITRKRVSFSERFDSNEDNKFCNLLKIDEEMDDFEILPEKVEEFLQNNPEAKDVTVLNETFEKSDNEISKLNETYEKTDNEASKLNETYEKTDNETSKLNETYEKNDSKLNETYELHSTSTEKGDSEMIIKDTADTKPVESQKHALTKEEEKLKAEKVLEWIQETKKTLMESSATDSFKANTSTSTHQVMSSRYSNVTPNDSLVNTSIAHLQVESAGARKVSILEIEVLKHQKSDAAGESKTLSRSPISKLSIACDTEILSNYNLNSPKNLNNEIPKSLRSTRKRIGSALTQLHNVSDIPQEFNDTLNVTANENFAENVGEFAEPDEEHILSLDNYQPNQEAQEPQAQTELAYNTNYIEFYRENENEDELEADEVVEVIDLSEDESENEVDQEESDDEIIEEEEESQCNNENNLDFTGVEYLEDDENEVPETEENVTEAVKAVEEIPEDECLEEEILEEEYVVEEVAETDNTPLFSDTEHSRVELDMSNILKTDTEESPVKEKEIANKSNLPKMEQEELNELEMLDLEPSDEIVNYNDLDEDALLADDIDDNLTMTNNGGNVVVQSEELTNEVNLSENLEESLSDDKNVEIPATQEERDNEIEEHIEIPATQFFEEPEEVEDDVPVEIPETQASGESNEAEEDPELFESNTKDLEVSETGGDSVNNENQSVAEVDENVQVEISATQLFNEPNESRKDPEPQADTTASETNENSQSVVKETKEDLHEEVSKLNSNEEPNKIEEATESHEEVADGLDANAEAIDDLESLENGETTELKENESVVEADENSPVEIPATQLDEPVETDEVSESQGECFENLASLENRQILDNADQNVVELDEDSIVDIPETQIMEEEEANEESDIQEISSDSVEVSDNENLENVESKAATENNEVTESIDLEDSDDNAQDEVYDKVEAKAGSSSNKDELQLELAGLSEEPQFKSDRRLTLATEKSSEKPSDSRKTMMPSEGSLSESFVKEVEYEKLQQELKGVSDAPEIKYDRRLTMAPEKSSEKSSDSRKTMIPSEGILSESFVVQVELQQELKGLSDVPELKSDRRLTLTPEKPSEKPSDSRKTMIPSEGSLSESFVKDFEYEKLQQELKGVSDAPEIKYDRRLTMAPENSSEKPSDSRKTMIPSGSSLSESFVEEMEQEQIQQELKGLSEVPELKSDRRLTLAPGKSSEKPSDSRKTMIPSEGCLSESFVKEVKYEQLQHELKEVSDAPEIKSDRRFTMAPEKSSEKPSDSRKTMIPSEGSLSESFAEEMVQEQIQQELKGLSDAPEFKSDRRLTLAPEKSSEKPSDSRKTIIPSEGTLSESFVKEVEYEILQQELKEVSDAPEIKSDRRLTMAPKTSSEKPSDSRKTMIPSDGSLSESFVEEMEHKQLQQELKGLSDAPEFKSDRRLTMAPEISSEKPSDSRKTMIPSEGTLSESFVKEVEHEQLQQELKGVSNDPEIKFDRRLTMAPGTSSEKPLDSRKTMIPSEGSLSESFVVQVELQQELKGVSDAPEIKMLPDRRLTFASENSSEKPSDSRKTMIPSNENLSESFVEQLKEKSCESVAKPTNDVENSNEKVEAKDGADDEVQIVDQTMEDQPENKQVTNEEPEESEECYEIINVPEDQLEDIPEFVSKFVEEETQNQKENDKSTVDLTEEEEKDKNDENPDVRINIKVSEIDSTEPDSNEDLSDSWEMLEVPEDYVETDPIPKIVVSQSQATPKPKSSRKRRLYSHEIELENLHNLPDSDNNAEVTPFATENIYLDVPGNRKKRGGSEQRTPAKKRTEEGKRAASVDQPSNSKTQEDEEKRPSRNRPKKIPEGFVLTPTRSRRRKPSKDVDQQEIAQENQMEDLETILEVSENIVEQIPEKQEAQKETVQEAEKIQKSSKTKKEKSKVPEKKTKEVPEEKTSDVSEEKSPEVLEEKSSEEEKNQNAETEDEKRPPRNRRKKIQNDFVETPKRVRRSRAEKAPELDDLTAQSEVAAPIPIQSAEIESTSADDEIVEVEEKEPVEVPKKRGRRVEKPAVPQKKESEEPESTSDEKAEEQKKPTKSRGRKAEAVKQTEETSEIPSSTTATSSEVQIAEDLNSLASSAETISFTGYLEKIDDSEDKRPVRNRKKKIPNDFVETPSRRTKKQMEAESKKEEDSNIEKKEKGRKRLMEEAVEDVSKTPKISKEDTPSVAKRSRKVIIAESEKEPDTPQTAKRRGRPAKEEEKVEKPAEAEKPIEEPKRRGRQAKEIEKPDETPQKETKRRGRPAREVEEKPVSEEEKVEVETKRQGRPAKEEKLAEQEKPEETPQKQTKRRGKPAKEEEEVEKSTEAEKPIEEPKRRGRQAKEIEKPDETPQKETKRRGKSAKEEEVDKPTETEKPVKDPKQTKKRGGRQEAKEEEKSSAESENPIETPQKQTKRRGKPGKAEEIPVEEKPAEAEKPVEEPKRRGRQAKAVENPVETPQKETKRRGKPASKTEEIPAPNVQEDIPAEEQKQTKRRGRPGKLNESSEEKSSETPQKQTKRSTKQAKQDQKPAAEETPAEEPKDTKRGAVKQSSEESSSKSEEEENAHSTKSRGRQTQKQVNYAESPAVEKTKKAPKILKRGRKEVVETEQKETDTEEALPSPPKKGRRAAVKETPVEKTAKVQFVDPETPAKSSVRGRKKVEDEAGPSEPATKKATRGKKAPEVIVIDLSSSQSEQESPKKATVKKTAGRRKATDAVENVETPTKKSKMDAPATRTTRNRNK